MNACSRREFLAGALAASSAAALCGSRAVAATEQQPPALPIVLFSKVYQSLKLNFDDAAALTAEAGLDGVDCPLRPGGEILPEHAVQELPQYVAALRKRRLQLPLLTTGITGVSSPHTQDILHTAKQQGVQYYRLGFVLRQPATPAAKQVDEVRAQLKDLAALNRQEGIGAIFQNHSPAGRSYVGGDLGDLYAIVKDLNPAEVGVAFDIGHALVVHGDNWRRHFEKLKSHIRIAYVKDVTRAGRWVPFGQGDIAATGYFKLLKQMSYRAPLSLHIEYDWNDDGKANTRGVLLGALQNSVRMLKAWLAP